MNAIQEDEFLMFETTHLKTRGFDRIQLLSPAHIF